MKNVLHLFSYWVLFGILVYSCAKPPFLTLNTPNSISFTDQGGTQNLTFATNRNWTISSSESWCKVSPSSGTAVEGEIRVSVSCEPNTTYDSRSCVLSLTVDGLTETISVNQATNYGLLVSPTTFNLTSAEQTIEVEVQANVNYSIEIDDSCQGWVSRSSTKALSTNRVTFHVAENKTYDKRDGFIFIREINGSLSGVVTICQDQFNEILVSPTFFDLDYTEQTVEIETDSNIDYDVVVFDNAANWVSVVSSSGTRSLKKTSTILSIQENPNYTEREGSVVIKNEMFGISKTITIKQAAHPTIYFTGESVFEVTCQAHWLSTRIFHTKPFSISAADSWLTCTIDRIDDNNSSVSVFVNNSFEDNRRTGTVTFTLDDGTASIQMTVIQDPEERIRVYPTKLTVSKGAQTAQLEIEVNFDFSVQTSANWLRLKEYVTEPSGLLLFEVDENTSGENREATIAIVSKTTGLRKDVPVTQIAHDYLDLTISLSSPGSLSNAIDLSALDFVRSLRLSGRINGSDIVIIRRMNNLISLDLLDATICSGGEAYRSSFRTSNNTIGDEMFFGMNSLQEVATPRNCTQIASRAFYNCYNLSKVTLNEGIVSIGDYAFLACSLTEIVFPSSLTSLGNQSFKHNLFESLFIPKKLTYLGQVAFNACPNIRLIKLESSIPPSGLPLFYNSYPDNITIYVPQGSYNSYFLSQWGNFKSIVEY